MAKKKRSPHAFFILTQPLAKGFMLSHILGWSIAWLQTVWIVHEIRKIGKKR